MTYGNLSSIRNLRLNLSSGSGYDANISMYMLQANRWILEQTEDVSVNGDTLAMVEEDYCAYLFRSQQVETWGGGPSESEIFKTRAKELLKLGIARASTDETGGGVWGSVKVTGD